MRNNPCRPGTRHHRRYEMMRLFLQRYPETTPADLLRHFRQFSDGYDKSDFDWDFKRGSIAIV